MGHVDDVRVSVDLALTGNEGIILSLDEPGEITRRYHYGVVTARWLAQRLLAAANAHEAIRAVGQLTADET